MKKTIRMDDELAYHFKRIASDAGIEEPRVPEHLFVIAKRQIEAKELDWTSIRRVATAANVPAYPPTKTVTIPDGLFKMVASDYMSSLCLSRARLAHMIRLLARWQEDSTAVRGEAEPINYLDLVLKQEPTGRPPTADEFYFLQSSDIPLPTTLDRISYRDLVMVTNKISVDETYPLVRDMGSLFRVSQEPFYSHGPLNNAESKNTGRFFYGRYVLEDVLEGNDGIRLGVDYIGPSQYQLQELLRNKESGFTEDEYIDILTKCRTIGGHMLFPTTRTGIDPNNKKCNKKYSLNTARAGGERFDGDLTGFHDCFYLLLYDLSRYSTSDTQSEQYETPKLAWLFEKNHRWFQSFADGAEGDWFKGFIEHFGLEPFVIQNEKDGRYFVRDLAVGGNAVMEDYPKTDQALQTNMLTIARNTCKAICERTEHLEKGLKSCRC